MWKQLLFGSGVVVAATAMMTASANEQTGAVYPLSEAIVYEKLLAAEIPPHVLSDIAQPVGTEMEVERLPGKGIVWTFKAGGHEMTRFEADIRAEGPNKTHVLTRFAFGDPLPAATGDKELAKGYEHLGRMAKAPFFRAATEIAGRERVAAILENRSFDPKRAQRATANYAGTHVDQVIAFNEIMQGASRDFQSGAARDPMEGDYGYGAIAESRGGEMVRNDDTQIGAMDHGPRPRPGQPAMSSKPMVDLSEYRN